MANKNKYDKPTENATEEQARTWVFGDNEVFMIAPDGADTGLMECLALIFGAPTEMPVDEGHG